MKTISDLLRRCKQKLLQVGIETYALDTELIFATALYQGSRETLLLHMTDAVDGASMTSLAQTETMLARRLRHEPMAYILNIKSFWKYDFYVDHRVLIPRQESEFIVETALQHIKCIYEVGTNSSGYGDAHNKNTAIRILDLGVGSGCLLLSIIKDVLQHHDINIIGCGVDISSDALSVAEHNAGLLGVQDRIYLIEHDYMLLGNLQISTMPFANSKCNEPLYDIIVANPPYITHVDHCTLPRSVAQFEPRIALTDEDDGLQHYTSIALYAHRYLAANGLLIVECCDMQAQNVAQILSSGNLAIRNILRDYAGLQRVVVATQTV